MTRTPSPAQRLRQITEVLLLSDNLPELDDAVLKLHSLLSLISGIDTGPADSSNSVDVALPFGAALCPRDAARCVLDSARTSKFLRGICAALRAAQRRFPNGPVEVLYAGCGPFATLAIPLTTQFKADEIQFTMLDIHARSLESVRRIIRAFGAEDYVRDCIQSDAPSYLHPRPLHLVIAEAMQKALSKEPQVAISLNLAPQLCARGIFIPERVSIDAYLCDPEKEFESAKHERDESSSSTQRSGAFRVKLGKILDLTAENATRLAEMSRNRGPHTEVYLPASAVNLPEELSERLSLMLSTTITIFESVTLGEYESGLTHPFWLHDFSGAKGGDRIEFRYCLKANPGFQWQLSSQSRR